MSCLYKSISLMSRNTLNINEPVDGAFDNVLNAALNIQPGSTPSNRHENLSNNLSSKKNSENIYNVSKLKNQNVRHKELRKYLLGVSNEWNSATLGPKKVTGLNFCLLYTSPSPRDKRQSRMPSSA